MPRSCALGCRVESQRIAISVDRGAMVGDHQRSAPPNRSEQELTGSAPISSPRPTPSSGNPGQHPRRWYARRSSRRRPWPRSARAQRCHAAWSASASRSPARDPGQLPTLREPPPVRSAIDDLRVILRRLRRRRPQPRTRGHCASDVGTTPSISSTATPNAAAGWAPTRSSPTTSSAPCSARGFSSAASYPDVSPPAYPQRDNELAQAATTLTGSKPPAAARERPRGRADTVGSAPIRVQ